MAMFSRSYTLGLVFIFLVGLIWAAASVLMQHIYQDMQFRSPFFLTYLTNSLLIMYLPLWQLWILCGVDGNGNGNSNRGKSGTPTTVDEDTINDLHDGDVYSTEISEGNYSQIPTYANNNAPVEPKAEPYTHLEVFQVALVIAPLYVLSNGLYNYSLFMTSVSSSTIISNLSGTFTFAFSYYLGLEGFTYGKVFGILACFMGAVCVGLNDSEQSDSGVDTTGQTSAQTVTGDTVAFCGAVCYGLYTTMVKYKIPDDNGISMQLLLGYVGLINVIFLAPVLLCLCLSGIEQLGNLTGAVLGFMVISGFFNNVISDYLWARSVVLTSSTVATVGLSITIPLAMISDLLVQGQAPTLLSASGAILVIIGFCLVNISKELEADLYMLLCDGGPYERLTKQTMPIAPLQIQSTDSDIDDSYIEL